MDNFKFNALPNSRSSLVSHFKQMHCELYVDQTTDRMGRLLSDV